MANDSNILQPDFSKNRLALGSICCLVLSFIVFYNCKPTRLIHELHEPIQFASSFQNRSDFIKIHMKDGGLFLLDSFLILSDTDNLLGYGNLYDFNRNLISQRKYPNDQPFVISLNSAALIETNRIEGVGSKLLPMVLLGVPTEVMSWICIINPKSCFGSCPTFYAWNGKEMSLMAEGFSSSILRFLEKSDIDMLYGSQIYDSSFHLKITNEALETHIIRYANILLFPREKEEQVFADQSGKFFLTSHIQSPLSCNSSEGDCLQKILKMDHYERYSSADPGNLARDEYINIQFDSIPGDNLGLVIGCRQTLMTTYLFYQGLALLGNSAGYVAARIESGDQKFIRHIDNIDKTLGGIEIQVPDHRGRMITVDTIFEKGPIAADVHLVSLPPSANSDLQIKLKLTKGLWRIDFIALTRLENEVEPIMIQPAHVFDSSGENDAVRQLLTNGLQPLVTLPGDKYDILYDIPYSPEYYDVFLSSQGYYLEWMRKEWLEEENLVKASLMFGMPGLYLRKIAREYSTIESKMEETFWKSKYENKP